MTGKTPGQRRQGRPEPPRRSHRTALVVVPPPELWPSIQTIRCEHDPLCRRWMPHITLVYPYRAPAELPALAPRLAAVCGHIPPFEIMLRRFGSFRGKGDRHLIWLAPEPAASLAELHQTLAAVTPEYLEPDPHAAEFMPHLTVGRVGGWANAKRELAVHQAHWLPLTFRVDAVHLLARGDSSQDAFQVEHTIPLGGLA